MWQQNCLLRKFGLLKSCQPITSHRPTDRQNTVLISLAYRSRLRLVPSDLTNRFSYLFLSEKLPACLSVTNTIIPKWFDNLFFTCFSVRKPQPASRLGLSGWPNTSTLRWSVHYDGVTRMFVWQTSWPRGGRPWLLRWWGFSIQMKWWT